MSAREHHGKRGFWLGDSVEAILDANRIPGRSPAGGRLRAGVDEKVLCPRCEGTNRGRQRTLCIRLDQDGMGVVWNCKRPSCGFTGSGRVEGSRRDDDPPSRRERRPVVPVTVDAERATPPRLFEWFAKRGISEETVREFGIYETQRRWPKFGDDGKLIENDEGKLLYISKPTVAFPYQWRGDLVNRKYRSSDKQFQQDKDSLRSLYNGDSITADDEAIFVEGEMDVLALWEAGFRQVVSLPDGAPGVLRSEGDKRREDDHRFTPLETCADVLAPLKKCILATDADVPGGYLAEEFARRLGRVRCWRVTWPEGCKDANDVLLRHVPKGEMPTPEQLELGRADIRRAVEGAQPWPLAGIVHIKQGQLSHFLRTGRGPRGLESGIRALDQVARYPAGAGWLTLVTGYPNDGKTTFVRAWVAWLAQKHDLGLVWCSPEDNRAETVALEVARIIAGQPLYDAGSYIPDEVLGPAEEWISKRITFLQSDDPDEEMSLDWVLAKAEGAKKRHPRHLLILDPWNEFEHQLDRNETETQYTGRWLRKLKAWGRAEGMNIMIVVHPQKPLREKGGKLPVAGGYDINGGANWYNKADLGLTVVRPSDGYFDVHNWKPRFRAFGKKHGIAKLKLNERNGRLSSAFDVDAHDEADLQEEP